MDNQHPDAQARCRGGPENVRAEQLRIFFAAAGRTLVPALLLGSIVLLTLLSAVRHWALAGWWLLLIGAYGLRTRLHSRAQRSLECAAVDLRTLERRAIAGAGLTGSAWGLLALLPLFTHQFEHLLFLTFVVGGVTASATPSLGAHRASAYAFVLPSLLPLTIGMLMQGTLLAAASAVMVLLYLWVVYATMGRVAAGLEQAVQLRVEADARGLALAASRAEQQRHQRLISIVAHSQNDFIRGFPVAQLLQTLLCNLLELSGARIAMILELSPPGAAPRLSVRHAQQDIDSTALPSAATAETVELLAASVLAGATLPSGAAAHPLCTALQEAAGQPLADCVIVPLQLGDAPIGLLGLGSVRGPLEDGLRNDLRSMSTTLAHLLLAIRNQQQHRATEAHLQRALSQLQTFVSGTPVAVAMLDRELQVVASSQRWLSDFGAPAQPVGGRSLYEVIPDIPLRWRESFARVLAGRVEVCDEDPFIRGDGTVRWLRWQAHPWYEADGGVGGLVLFSEDVTAQKKTTDSLYARERLLEQLTDRVPGLLFQMRQRANGERSLLYVSSGSLRVLRMTPDVLIENPARIFDACHPADRQLLDAAVARAETNGLLQATYRSECANGEIRWLSILADATRLADASCVWHGYIEDITEHVRLREHCSPAPQPAGAHEPATCPLRHAALDYTRLGTNLEATT